MMRWPAILAVVVLFVNDHVLKAAFPGWITGKLSDVAGMVFFPLFLADVATWFRPTRRPLAIACIATALVFALVKTSVLANAVYRDVWGHLRAPISLALGHRPSWRVVLVRDPSDLLAVPFVLVAWLVGTWHSPARCAASFRSWCSRSWRAWTPAPALTITRRTRSSSASSSPSAPTTSRG